MEKYVITIENYGRFEEESDNVFFALDQVKAKIAIKLEKAIELVRSMQLNITSAFVIKGNDSIIDITEYI